MVFILNVLFVGGSGKYFLKPNLSNRAEVWKKCLVVFEKGDADKKSLNFCACNKCLKVYALKDASGRLNGTKNLLEHLNRCPGMTSQKQLQLQQCLTQKPQVSKADLNHLGEYGLSENDTPVTTDHGSNIVAALRNTIRLDCLCHRLHTVLESAWRDTRRDEPEAAAYETAISEVCRFAKQSTGLQEQLTKSLKHGGDTRPWVSMYRRAESVECSYESLVTVLTAKNKLEMIANVNRDVNRDILELTKGIKDVFESPEKVAEPTLQLVAPAYYLLHRKMKPGCRESSVIQKFKENLLKYLDEKFWTSIKALHWMATFVDPSFKQLEFIPAGDVKFKRNLVQDMENWVITEMKVVADRQTVETDSARLEPKSFY